MVRPLLGTDTCPATSAAFPSLKLSGLPRALRRPPLPSTSPIPPTGGLGQPWLHSQDESDRQSRDGPQRNVLHVRACARMRGLHHSPSHLPAWGSPKAPPRHTQKGGATCGGPGGGPGGADTTASAVALLRAPPLGGGGAAGRFPLPLPVRCCSPQTCPKGAWDANLAGSQPLSPGVPSDGRFGESPFSEGKVLCFAALIGWLPSPAFWRAVRVPPRDFDFPPHA